MAIEHLKHGAFKLRCAEFGRHYEEGNLNASLINFPTILYWLHAKMIMFGLFLLNISEYFFNVTTGKFKSVFLIKN